MKSHWHWTYGHKQGDNKISSCKMACGIRGLIMALVMVTITTTIVNLVLHKNTQSSKTNHGLFDNMEESLTETNRQWQETFGYKTQRSFIKQKGSGMEIQYHK